MFIKSFMLKIRYMKMKQKILFLTVLPMIITFLITTSLYYNKLKDSYYEKIFTTTTKAVELTAQYLDSELTGILNLANFSISDDELTSLINNSFDSELDNIILVEKISFLLNQLAVMNQWIDSADAYVNNQWVYSLQYPHAYDHDEIWDKTSKNMFAYWGENPLKNKFNGNLSLPLVIRFPGQVKEENKLIIYFSYDKLYTIIEELNKEILGEVFVIQGENILVGDKERLNKGKAYNVFTQKINVNGWEVVCTQNHQLIQQIMIDSIKITLIYTLAIMMIFIIISGLIAKTITDPIKEISDVAMALSKHQYYVRYNGTNHDEIGQLGQTMNDLCEELEDYKNLVKNREKIIKETAYQKRKIELKVLQSQINPHFIYNTLDSMYWFTLGQDREKVANLILSLSKMLRLGLSKGGEIISLRREIEHAENYLKIQKIIHQDLFDYEINFDTQLESCKIMKIVLQPLIENAIIHGFRDFENGGLIKISIKKQNDYCKMIIEDNGKGFDTQEVKNKNKGFALKNIKQRLNLYYGKESSITISSHKDNGTTINIRIPINLLEA